MAKTKQYDKGNKGEWSEVYVFFHILGTKAIHPCDNQLKKLDTAYPVLEIIRKDNKAGEQHFILNGDSISWNNKTKKITVDAQNCSEEAQKLLQAIKISSGPTFKIPASYDFLCSIGCGSIKADKDQKEDLTLVIKDARSGDNPTCGFSIKSYIGSNPTLLNASKSCCFWYQIYGVSEEEIKKLNKLSPANIIKGVYERGGTFKYLDSTSEGSVFRSNLRYIDTKMPNLLAELVLYAYRTNIKNLDEVVPKFATECDIFSINDSGWYQYKIKKLLEASALGMTPAKQWRGEEDANGGFIAVKPNGEVVTYHIYDRLSLLEYLYHNTYIEHADTDKFDYGKIDLGNPCKNALFKYVLQIRFKSYTKTITQQR